MGNLTRDATLKARVTKRLRTVSGHLVAVERMAEQERYCVDILKQISAVHASLSKVAHALSDAHMRHCVGMAIAEGKGEEEVEGLLEMLKHLKHFLGER